MREILPSVGIDIGTSTTQVIFSKLEIDNTSGFGAIPKIEIVSKEIIYESPVYTTPLRNEWEIDAEQVKKILFHEYEQAGIKPEELATGAVIITGESVKKKNAGCTAKQLSEIAGDFVVVTAGPDLESVLAGCGSGAAKLSEICGGLVANLDIGGGTTNICIFENGKVIDTACLDIGGRLIRIEDETIQYMSESIVKISTDIKSSLVVGAQIDKTDLKPLLQRMIQLLEEEMGFRQKTDLLSAVYTNHGLKKNYKLSHIVLSGGVAACVQALNNSADGKIEDEFLYDDIGVLLAEELKNSLLYEEMDQKSQEKLLPQKETLRATVIGAGNYAVHISGSTITCCDGNFPYKNVSGVRISLTCKEEIGNIKGEIREQLRLLFEQDKELPLFAISFAGIPRPGFYEIEDMAEEFCKVCKQYNLGNQEKPVILIMEEDHGKSLGQALRRKLKHDCNIEGSILSIDCVKCKSGDYVDIGKPVSRGTVIPIVVKTLIFE